MVDAGPIVIAMTQQHAHHHEAGTERFTAEFWDERYGSRPAIWSGNPNQRLVEQVADLAPGQALDVGSGEGADAIWLAQRGTPWPDGGYASARPRSRRAPGPTSPRGSPGSRPMC